jgi:hypothetical protein
LGTRKDRQVRCKAKEKAKKKPPLNEGGSKVRSERDQIKESVLHTSIQTVTHGLQAQ